MVLKIFFPQCCNTAESGLLVGRWIPGHDSAVVLAVIHYPFIPGQVKKYLSELQSQTQVDLTVLGSWSMPKEGQEGMDSFLKDLSTVFPQKCWLQLSREIGKRGFTSSLITKRQKSGLKYMCQLLRSVLFEFMLVSYGFEKCFTHFEKSCNFMTFVV
uniref:Phosphatidylinositol glycan anchor biosynthesis, class Q n=1 Tax=Sinocyclocheilus grahami TaxID=75366 RepID=A0A672K317_SINGR